MPIKLQLSRSLRVRITFSSLLVFLVSIWALQAYTSQMLRNDMLHILGEQQLSTVSVLAGQVNQEIDKRFKALESLARAATPKSEGQAPAMQSLLADRTDLLELFNRGGFITGMDGIALASYPESMGRLGLSYVDRDYIQAALTQGKTTVGRAVIGRPLGTPVISMATPIRNQQGQVVGAIAGTIDLGQPNFLDAIVSSSYGETGGFFIVSPRHRLIVLASDKSRVMQSLPPEGENQDIDQLVRGFEGTVLLTNQLGQQVLNSGQHIPLANWDLVASLPALEAFAPVKAMQERMLVAAGLLSTLVIGVIWWLLSWHFRPLAHTIKSLTRRRQHDELLSPLPAGRHDEVGQVIGAFNRLLERLQKQDADLQISNVALASISEAVVITDTKHDVVSSNAAHELITGYSAAEIMGKNLRLLQGRDTDANAVSAIHEALQRQAPFTGEILNYRKDGVPFWNDLSITPLCDAQGNLTHFVSVTRDITDKKHMDEQVRQLAYYDALTHLANRRLLIDRLSQALISCQRNSSLGAMVFLDLDNFKPLNDLAGHAVGDLLLVEVAQRLKACVRAVDTVARFGGDEFVVMLVDLPENEAEAKAQALSIAEKIRASLAEPFVLQPAGPDASGTTHTMPSPIEHRCTASVGLALFDGRQTSPEEIIQRADAAMYRAKNEGRNRVVADGDEGRRKL